MANSQPQISRRFCKRCEQHLLFEKRRNLIGNGEFLLALVTLGLYVVVKWGIQQITNPWRCEHCHGRHWFWWRD